MNVFTSRVDKVFVCEIGFDGLTDGPEMSGSRRSHHFYNDVLHDDLLALDSEAS